MSVDNLTLWSFIRKSVLLNPLVIMKNMSFETVKYVEKTKKRTVFLFGLYRGDSIPTRGWLTGIIRTLGECVFLIATEKCHAI